MAWNELRRKTLRIALHDHLLPALKSELRLKLASKALEKLKDSYAKEVTGMLKRGPYTRGHAWLEEGERPAGVRVMACIWEQDTRDAFLTVVLIARGGELEAELKVPFMKLRTDEGGTDRPVLPCFPSNITRECPPSLLISQGNALLPF